MHWLKFCLLMGGICWTWSGSRLAVYKLVIFVWVDSWSTSQQFFNHVGMLVFFLGWTSTKQGLMCLAQGHITQCCWWGSNPRPLHLESSTQPLSHFCTPANWLSADDKWHLPGHVAQSVTCLATNVSLTADPGVGSLIPAWSHTFMEIDHEIISPPFCWIIQEGLLSVTRERMCTKYPG